MAFYAFSLARIDTVFQRGKLDDVDLITYQVLVNQQLRAAGAGSGVGHTGFSVSMGAVAIEQASGPLVRRGIKPGPFGWLAGPLSLRPGDAVQIIYSGTNTSDSELGSDQVAKIEIKILDLL